MPSVKSGPSSRNRTAARIPRPPITAAVAASGAMASAGFGRSRTNATTPPSIEIASQATIRRLCPVPGAMKADEMPRTTR
jgi:hypothetical protein